jgi:formate hydrogenlyase subunit 6/NADH:ubiquinone oxidoreductase subunit I
MTIEKELLENAMKKPATLLYPSEKALPVERIRGRVAWEIEECIGCGLCSKICPSEAIEMIGKGREADIIYHLDRCMFCGECVDICPTKAIRTTSDYELASATREEMTIHYRRKEKYAPEKESQPKKGKSRRLP